MDEISDTSVMTALRRQLSLAAARQAVAAGNLANLDTPGYRSREVDFAAALDRQVRGGLGLAVTDAGHLGRNPDTAPPVKEAEGLAARRDGNNVSLDRELLSMMRASGDFAAAQTALAAKFRLVRYALSEGR